MVPCVRVSFFTNENYRNGIDFDESAATLRIFGGYKLNDWVSFEAGQAMLFESSASYLGTDVDIEGTAWDVSVRPTFPLSDNFQIFAIAGVTQFNIDIRVSGPGGSVSDDDTSTELMYGLGGMFTLNDRWSLRGEWLIIDVDDADFNMLSVSASYNLR